ncbi:MAG: hypothetical protein QG641_2688 [Candidatus Poribacteria bacterium]|nr:hypothetical protein [Candidatus Poribacteria bacterium]
MIKKVYVYVEGPSDKYAMETLLHPLIEQKKHDGVTVDFLSEGSKEALLEKVPKRTINIILNEPNSFVVVIPDLYPRDLCFKHATYDELKEGILSRFNSALRDKHINESDTLLKRFKIFCFKYDLESLILASIESLKLYLGVNELHVTWNIPVEDQNHEEPPKNIIKCLFSNYGKKYNETFDAPLILSMSSYEDITDRCRQCFKPFVDFLKNLPEND